VGQNNLKSTLIVSGVGLKLIGADRWRRNQPAQPWCFGSEQRDDFLRNRTAESGELLHQEVARPKKGKMLPLINQSLMETLQKNQEQPIFSSATRGWIDQKKERFFWR
jgi:hypothetical protein